MWEENRDKKNRKAKVNSLYKKKKTAAKFSLASFFTAGESCSFLLRDALDRDVKHTGE